MISRLGRRALDALVVLFAVLGFCFVPLGKKTGLEHAKAMLSTGAAKEAGAELLEASRRVRDRVLDVVRAPSPETPTPEPARDESLIVATPAADAGADASVAWSSLN